MVIDVIACAIADMIPLIDTDTIDATAYAIAVAAAVVVVVVVVVGTDAYAVNNIETAIELNKSVNIYI